MRIAVLVSGSGTNLQAILDAARAGCLEAEVALVVSNKANAMALTRAHEAHVPSLVVSHKDYATREAYDAALVSALREHGVELVVLAGFMRIVTPVLLAAFPNRVLNIHPSLLPAFPGLDAQRQAFEAGVAVTGCTVHLVDGGMDTGPIVAQTAVVVRGDDDEATLRARILVEEHRLLPRVIQWFARGLVTIDHGRGVPRVVVAGQARGSFGEP